MTRTSIVEQIRCLEQIIFQRQLSYNTNAYQEQKPFEFLQPLRNEIRNLQKKLMDLTMMLEIAD